MLRLLFNVVFKSLLPLLITLGRLGLALWLAGYVPMVEAAVCKEWYQVHGPSQISSDGQISSSLCKRIEIQREVAYIRGGQIQADAFMTLVVAFPYAWLERRVKSKFLLVAACVGILLQYSFVYGVCLRVIDLPLRSVWISSCFFVIGGGVCMADLYLWSMLTATIPESARSSIFFVVSSMGYATKFLSTWLVALLLQSSPWSVFPVAMFSAATMILLLVCNIMWDAIRSDSAAEPDITSSATYKDSLVVLEAGEAPLENDGDEADWCLQDTLLGEHDLLLPGQQPVINAICSTSQNLTPWQFLRHVCREYLAQQIFLVYFGFLICYSLSSEIGMILQQWLSLTFSWPLSMATAVMAYGMSVSFIILMVLPAIHSFLSKRLTRTVSFDLLLVQINDILRMIGNFVMGLLLRPEWFLVGLTINHLGVGAMDAERAFAASIVPAGGTITEVYTIRMVIQNLADMASGSVWAAVFTKQASLGGVWRGLPFLISGMFLLICLLLTWRLKILVRNKHPPVVETR